MSKISVSILAANFLRLEQSMQDIVRTGCDSIHFDVMDGIFVPNLSFGPSILKDIRAEYDISTDVHLMLENPLPYILPFIQSGADAVTVHIEARNFAESLTKIHASGIRAGASIKPGTSAIRIKPFFHCLDQVLVMTVEPGFGGQRFMKSMIGKVRMLRDLGFVGEIQVDGGVNYENAKLLAAAGADTMIMGTSYFRADDPQRLAEAVHLL